MSGYAGGKGPPLQPSVLWAQRKDSVFVTVDVKDAADVHFQLEESSLDFAAKGGEDGSAYAFHLDLYAPIRREESKFSTKRCPTFFLQKSSAESWPRLQKEGKLPWVKIDWHRWADSDDEDEKGAFDTGDLEGLDFEGHEDNGSDDRDSLLADLDEDIAVFTDDEAS
ncbi:unnamed protein product [Durusdinium trenchii]|uniref:CS domain-containing protein n=1 Tax=Durusdinium trenchii TaxID=1381693 RepID=A0ABP0P9D0_9DINO